MKLRLLIPVIFVGFTAACVSDDSKRAASKSEAAPPAKQEKLLILPWKAEYNSEHQKLQLKFVKESRVSNLSAQDMIDAINLKHPEIKLQNKGMSGDTLLVAIPDAAKLTGGSGSAGAESFLAESTFSLTELNGIKAVRFDFKEGDHAVPKTYSRKDFEDFN